MVRQSSRSAASRAREALQSTAPQKRKTSGEAKQPAKRGKEEQENEGEEQEQVKQGKHDQSETKPEPEQEQEQEREEEKRDDKYRETDAKKGQEQHVKEEQEEPSTGVKAEAKTETKGEAEAETHADYGAHTENATDEGHAANVLEKGIIYFFFRGKMNVDDPADMEDVARTFIVLRPIPPACHLEEGIEGEKGVKKEETGEQGDEAKKEQEQKQQQQQDDKPRALPKGGEKKCRLLILPKKTLPASPKDRFVSWVEKAGTDIETIRNSFKGEEHQTKTRGLRHTPGVTPFAEGVYAITSNGPQAGAGSHRTSGASHIAYMLTVPNEMTQVQIDFGLEDKGSFIAQVKNPSYKGPRFAPSRAPEYPPEIKEQFDDYRWIPVQPELIDFPNAQVLLIGEAQGRFGAGGITDDQLKGEKGEDAAEEIEGLQHANEIRVEPMKGQDAIFEDLRMNKDIYPKVASSWEQEEAEDEQEEGDYEEPEKDEKA